MEMLKYQRSI